MIKNFSVETINNLDLAVLKDLLNITFLNFTNEQLIKLRSFLNLLTKFNKIHNLTAMREIELLITDHLRIALLLAPYIKKNLIIDLGTGCGIPGIPLAILFPEKFFYLIDSRHKKVDFCEYVKLHLNLKNVNIIYNRVENYQPDVKFDHLTSRGFASLDQMVKLSRHLAAPASDFLAIKSAPPLKELKTLTHLYSDINYNIHQLTGNRTLVQLYFIS